MNTNPQSQSTDKVPIRQADGTIVMVSVPTGITQNEKSQITKEQSTQEKIPKKQDTKQQIQKPQTSNEQSTKEEVTKNQSVIKTETQSKEATVSKKSFDSHLDDLEGSIALASTPPVYATDAQGMPPAASAVEGIDWQQRVEEVVQKITGTKLDDEQLQRFRSITLSRLRDVRDAIHTKEALQKPRTSGGLGLDEAQANELLGHIESVYADIHASGAIASAKQPTASTRPNVPHDPYVPNAELSALAEGELPYTPGSPYLQAIAKQYNPKVSDPTAEPGTIAMPDIAPKPKVSPDEIAELATIDMSNIPAATDKPAYTSGRLDAKPISIIKPTNQTAPKPSMQEVVAKKRLVGPIDELKNMRLVDFRRLAGSTTERLAKITDKINEMEDESFTKKVEAIKAWRKSSLYQQYLDIGSESLSSGTGVADVIRTREQGGKETMNLEEFEQLTDFNKHLRY